MIALDVEQNENHLLVGAEGTLRPKAAMLLDLVGWAPIRDGVQHPAICTNCGVVLDRNVDLGDFVPKKNYDLSVTYDGWFVVSQKCLDFLKQFHPEIAGRPIPRLEGRYILENVPIVEIDIDASGIRRDCLCPSCGFYGEELFGLTNDQPPRAKPLVLKKARAVLDFAVSDLCFGDGFLKTPKVFVSDVVLEGLEKMTGARRLLW